MRVYYCCCLAFRSIFLLIFSFDVDNRYTNLILLIFYYINYPIILINVLSIYLWKNKFFTFIFILYFVFYFIKIILDYERWNKKLLNIIYFNPRLFTIFTVSGAFFLYYSFYFVNSPNLSLPDTSILLSCSSQHLHNIIFYIII